MTSLYTNGLGGSAGASLVLVKPLLMTGKAWYVSSVSGSGDGSGVDRKDPVATLSAAISLASADDVIVLLADHTETIAATVAISKRLVIAGEGSTSGVPTVTFTIGHASNDMFNITAAGVVLANVKFKPHTSGSNANYIDSSTAVDDVLLDGCYFEMNKFSDEHAVRIPAGADNWWLRNCTFVSTETSTAQGSEPHHAVITGGAISGLRLDGCIFDGGVTGFSDGSATWAFDGSAGAISMVRMEGISLLRGADMKLHASSTGYINVQTSTDDSRVEW